MSSIDLNALRAEMELDLEWREREMRIFRNQVASLPSSNERRVARKMLVVMLYSHFEGVCKTVLSAYATHLNRLGLAVVDVDPALGAASLHEIFVALRDSNKKCVEFKHLLPDDTQLHRFAREREFIEVAWKVGSRPVRINIEKVIDTESNLKPAVLRKLLFQLGLNHNLAEPWEGSIDHLLRRRNAVAHGAERGGLDENDYAQLEAAVGKVVDGLIASISQAVVERSYLAAPEKT